ncbi:MAG: pantoate--beta-alanine ligase [Weeksellaceae bacterium]|nr:pantoate--beta-alanine ligase [Weeksellaceae bacterium]
MLKVITFASFKPVKFQTLGNLQIFRQTSALQDYIAAQREQQKTIGFVPTMGALHAGHISLVQQCLQENDVCVVSIFVNPTQFNNAEDLEKYPRTEQEDIRLLENHGCQAVFIPSVQEIYPYGASIGQFDFGTLDKVMEGEHRPGHFAGVATVVQALFEAVMPDRAYFGEKDYQQLRIIQDLTAQVQLPISIVPVSIMREPDGLAMSSRNVRLSPAMRQEAPIIYQSLQAAAQMLPTHSVQEINNMVQSKFRQSNLQLEYFIIADAQHLQPLDSIPPNTEVRAFIAAHAGNVRLIDNTALN